MPPYGCNGEALWAHFYVFLARKNLSKKKIIAEQKFWQKKIGRWHLAVGRWQSVKAAGTYFDILPNGVLED